jgi:hypothetical protein
MKFEIKLLPEDAANRHTSLNTLHRQMEDFAEGILGKTLFRKEYNERLLWLGRDILNCRFWGALAVVDGAPMRENSPLSKEENDRRNEETKRWARDTFNPMELEQLLNIAVNQALLHPIKTSWPGTRIGHSVLYDQLVQYEGSMFREAVTDPFKRKLNNGRFWEELPETIMHGTRYEETGDVLMNHLDNLNPWTSAENLALMEYAIDGSSYVKENLPHRPGMNALKPAALRNYLEFLERSRQQGTMPKGGMETLIKPYISAMLEPRQVMDDTRTELVMGSFRHCILKRYMEESTEIQKHTAKHIVDTILADTSENTQLTVYYSFAAMSDPQAVMYKVMGDKRMRSQNGYLALTRGKDTARSLQGFMPYKLMKP